ncbi:hypothetical protein ACC691_37225, partial [Rhizobium johnstonii]|uniref:hypothetical protein n=1 Tax=Rhizobium johnstonii TaxID=3019933 RepID=UPI003F9C030D
AHSDPINLGTFIADANGVIHVQAQLPADMPAGTHHLYIVDENGIYHLVSEFTVTAAGNRTLVIPGLGFEGAPYAVVSALLLLAGAALTVVRRRRAAAE